MPSLYCCKNGNVSASIRYYCKFLEYTWGRGVFFFFVGKLLEDGYDGDGDDYGQRVSPFFIIKKYNQ
jgi:hypothetical protein